MLVLYLPPSPPLSHLHLFVVVAIATRDSLTD